MAQAFARAAALASGCPAVGTKGSTQLLRFPVAREGLRFGDLRRGHRLGDKIPASSRILRPLSSRKI